MEKVAIKTLPEIGKYFSNNGLYAKTIPVERMELVNNTREILFDLMNLLKAMQSLEDLFDTWKELTPRDGDAWALSIHEMRRTGEFLFPMMETALTTASLKVEILAKFLEHGGESS